MQLVSLKSMDGADVEWCKEVKGNMYDMVVEGFQLLSKWTARIWEQCAWKFSRPCKDPISTETLETSASYSDYEKVLFVFILLSKGSYMMKKNDVWSFCHFQPYLFTQASVISLKLCSMKHLLQLDGKILEITRIFIIIPIS